MEAGAIPESFDCPAAAAAGAIMCSDIGLRNNTPIRPSAPTSTCG